MIGAPENLVSIGPILECPNGLDSRIPELAQSTGIRVEVVHGVEPSRAGESVNIPSALDLRAS
jgi:hypothetical protein